MRNIRKCTLSVVKVPVFLLLVMLASGWTPGFVLGADDGVDPIYERWAEAAFLRGGQQYAAAEEILRKIIAEYPADQSIERRAWCEIIFTRSLGGSLPEQQAGAREALRIYPDLTADTVYIPESVNALLDAERRRMFGSLTIREPEGAAVFLDSLSVGEVPLFLAYLEVGEYELLVTKEGHEDYVEMFTVDPEGRHQFEQIPLKRRRNAWYWLSRVGGGAVVAGTIVYFAGQGGDNPTDPDLPGAPGPPSSK